MEVLSRVRLNKNKFSLNSVVKKRNLNSYKLEFNYQVDQFFSFAAIRDLRGKKKISSMPTSATFLRLAGFDC